MTGLSFPVNIYLGALAGAFLATLVSVPLWRGWCLRHGLVDDPGQRKIHAEPMPLAGGLAVLTGFLAPLILGVVATKFHWLGAGAAAPIGHGLSRKAEPLGAIIAGAVAVTGLGYWDDRRELRPLPKFAGQLLIALLLAAAGVRVTLFVHNLAFSYAVTALWMLTVINAFNFMDNMNGLCAGLGLIAGWCFAVIAAASGQYLVAVVALLACGALLGFLPYNFPRARTFLGDAGSHLVGYLLAVLAILPHFYSRENPSVLAVLKPLLILAVPLGDLVWVVALRWRLGRPFYEGDTNHLSHRLVRGGLSRTRAVVVIWLLGVLAGALAVG